MSTYPIVNSTAHQLRDPCEGLRRAFPVLFSDKLILLYSRTRGGAMHSQSQTYPEPQVCVNPHTPRGARPTHHPWHRGGAEGGGGIVHFFFLASIKGSNLTGAAWIPHCCLVHSLKVAPFRSFLLCFLTTIPSTRTLGVAKATQGIKGATPKPWVPLLVSTYPVVNSAQHMRGPCEGLRRAWKGVPSVFF